MTEISKARAEYLAHPPLSKHPEQCLRKAYGIPSPGKAASPCSNEECEWPPCASARRVARATCLLCGEPIGFDKLILFAAYRIGDILTVIPAHEMCEE